MSNIRTEKKHSLKPPKFRFLNGDQKRVDRFRELFQDPDTQEYINEVLCQYITHLGEGVTLEQKAHFDSKRIGAKEFANMLPLFAFPDEILNPNPPRNQLDYTDTPKKL